MLYKRKIYVLKRDEKNPENSKLIPEDGILATRNLRRLEGEEESEIEHGRQAFRRLSSLYYELLRSKSALYGLTFTVDKNTEQGEVRTLVYFTTEYDIPIPIEPEPLEEFTRKPSEEFLKESYDTGIAGKELIKITGVLYPRYRIERGEIFYIPYTYSFAIALRNIRFRALMLRLGKVEELDKLSYLEEARPGVDKIVMMPFKEEE